MAYHETVVNMIFASVLTPTLGKLNYTGNSQYQYVLFSGIIL